LKVLVEDVEETVGKAPEEEERGDEDEGQPVVVPVVGAKEGGFFFIRGRLCGRGGNGLPPGGADARYSSI